MAQNKFDFDTTLFVGKEKQIFNQRQILIDKNDNKYVIGFYKGTINIGTFTFSTSANITNNISDNSKGLFIAKYNEKDSLLWAQAIAESELFSYFFAKMDNASNLYFAFQYKNVIIIKGDTVQCYDAGDICLVKFNENGDKLYTKVVNNYGNETITNFDFDDNNCVIITGGFGNDTSTNYPLIFDSDTIYANKYDIFLVKLDSIGNTIWAKSYGGNGSDGSTNITYHNNSIYILGNVFYSNSINFGGLSINFPANYNSYGKFFIAKLDTFGNAIWVKKFGSKYNNALGYVIPKSIAVKSDKVYFTALGNDQNQLEFLFEGGANLLGTGLSNFESFIAAYDTAGNFKWHELLTNKGIDHLNQLTTDSNNNVIGIGGSEYTLRAISYDTAGNHIWDVYNNSTGFCTTVGSGIAKDTHGKLYVVGGTNCTQLYMGNDTLYPPANQSTMFFSSLDSIDATWTVGTNEPSRLNTELVVYPNPASEILHIHIPINNHEGQKIELQNTLGQLLYSSLISYLTSPISIDVSNYPNGVYFISYKSRQRLIAKKLLVHH